MIITTNHGFAANQADEDALVLEGALIIIRTDLIDPPPSPPETVLDLQMTDHTDATGKSITNNGVTFSSGVGNFSSGYLLTPDSNDLDFNNEDFSIEIEFKLATLSNGSFQHLIGKGSSSTAGWYVAYCSSSSSGFLGKIQFASQNNAVRIIGNANISDTTTFHTMKLQRVDGVTSMYVDNNLIGTSAIAPQDTSGAMTIGAYYANIAASKFTGSINSVLITKG
jgi:hypothetical protein